jgi:lipoprotein-releasing system permease protein
VRAALVPIHAIEGLKKRISEQASGRARIAQWVTLNSLVYQSLLTRKYLTSKIMPLLAMAAVMLSVATILITWSVMGGFLNNLVASGRSMIGDVAIVWPNVGFAHYDELIEMLEEEEGIDAATPVIESFGMVKLPNDQVEIMQIKGVDPMSFSLVTSFEDNLWWKPLDEPTPKDKKREDLRLDPEYQDLLDDMLTNGQMMQRPSPITGMTEPAGLIGIELTGLNFRTDLGLYEPMNPVIPKSDGNYDVEQIFMPRDGSISLTVLSLDSDGRPVDPVTKTVPIANEFQTGLYEVDSSLVIVRLDMLQQMLRMDEAKKIIRTESTSPFEYERDPESGELRPKVIETVGVDPARVTAVLVRGSADDANETRKIVRAVYERFAKQHAGEVPDKNRIQIRTWEDANRTMIEAVKKETGLVLFIFGIISFTNVFLVLAIFWSMASEKTRDIGILRALGASTTGIAWLWIRYGAVIGLVGAVLGTILGIVIVININDIHDWIGQIFGVVIWDPSVYYFVEIPRVVEVPKAIIVFIVGIVTCMLGALIPALHSARMDPVKALRFE